MKRMLFASVALTLFAVRARAEEWVKPYTPRAGIWEFELDGPAFPIGQINFVAPLPAGIGATGIITEPQRGLGISSQSRSGGGTTSTVGASGAFGYCASDLLEIGAALGFNLISPPNGAPGASSLNIEPFLKFNIGGGMALDSRLNPFILVGAGINYTASNGSGSSGPGSNSTFIIPELALGLEAMVTRWWGVSLYVPFTMAINLTSGAQDNKVIGVGLAYGLAAYFN